MTVTVQLYVRHGAPYALTLEYARPAGRDITAISAVRHVLVDAMIGVT